MNYVSFNDVTIDYGHVRAISNLSFDIIQGEYKCIIGSNGSGKSTIIKGLLGLITPTSGKILLNIDKADIAYVPQVSAATQKFPATVFEIVITGTQKKQNKLPFYTKKDIDTAHNAIAIMGISHISNKRIGHLSSGQHQRVLLARALCKNPKLLILDEPCANLDEQITESLSDVLQNLNKEKHITVLMASHNMRAIKRLASNVLVVNKSLIFHGTLDDYDAFKNRGDV